jgi:hypothetical protein
MAFVSEGDSLWIVWGEKGTRFVYPCKVLEVSDSHSNEHEVAVRLRFYQDNGFWDENNTATVLRKKDMYSECTIKAQCRQHVDWAHRNEPVGEPPGEFCRSAHLAAVLATRKNKQPAGGEQNDEQPQLKRANTEPQQAGPSNQPATGGELQQAVAALQGEMIALTGKIDAWDTTVQRMQEYQRQQSMLAEEIRKLKRASGLDAAPAEVQVRPEQVPAKASTSDPLCSSCKSRVAYDMPLGRLAETLVGDGKLSLSDLFTIPGGRVKAGSPLKKMVLCDSCNDKGSLKLVICTSGGAGNRLTCDKCRCRMTTNTTDATSMWCGKKHSNCRSLVIENETDRQSNTLFLTKGLAPVRDVVPYDEVRLIDVGLEQYNDCDYAIVASSSLSKSLVILEIDNQSHSSGAQYTPELEAKKNDGNFAAGLTFDKVLFIRINPSGPYRGPSGEQENPDKKARWLVARDWMVTFLRAPWGTWSFADKALVYLFYEHGSALIDRRPNVFDTVVAYRGPSLPANASELADYACTLDPYLMTKGSSVAQECLALNNRFEQPSRV